MIERVIAVCRRASDPPVKGSVGGFRCLICGEPVRATIVTAGRIIAGEMAPMCNDCGFKAASAASEKGILAGVLTTPEAMRQMAERPGADFERWFSGPSAICAHCGRTIKTREEALNHQCRP